LIKTDEIFYGAFLFFLYIHKRKKMRNVFRISNLFRMGYGWFPSIRFDSLRNNTKRFPEYINCIRDLVLTIFDILETKSQQN